MVHLAGYAVAAYLRVEVEGHVEHRGVVGQGDKFTLGCKHHNLRCKQIEFKRIEKVDGVRFRIVEYILDCAQPCVKFALLVTFADFIFPVGGKPLFCDFVHAARAYLHFNPVAVRSHRGHVQSLISVGLGVSDPVACAVGVEAVKLVYRSVYLPADSLLFRLVLAVEYDAHGIEVIYFFKRYMLGLHLVPDGIYRFYAGFHRVFQPHVVEYSAYRRSEILIFGGALLLGLLYLFGQLTVGVGMLVFERQVLKLCLYGEQAEAVCERSVYVECLSSNLILLVGRHGA